MEAAHPEHLLFAAEADEVTYRGRHRGYERLASPVTHERTFRFKARRGELTIVDRLSGTGKHNLGWHFHGAPGVKIEAVDARTFRFAAGDLCYRLAVPEGLTASVSSAWYSPSYGVRLACQALDLRAATDLQGEANWTFTLIPWDELPCAIPTLDFA
jgi:hypothetical protein